jgi:hypothetical protein
LVNKGKKRPRLLDPGPPPQLLTTTAADHYFCDLVVHLTVKDHAFGCKPVVELFWSS